MGNRCPDCNKFVGLETEIEETSVEVEENGELKVEARVYRICAECGTEMKEAYLDGSVMLDILEPDWWDKHSGEDDQALHGEYEASMEDLEYIESGGGRYAKNVIGFSAEVNVKCRCGDEITVNVSSEGIPASEFDELT